MLEPLSYFESLTDHVFRRNRIMQLYRDVLDISDDAEVMIRPDDAVRTVLAELNFDLNVAMMPLAVKHNQEVGAGRPGWPPNTVEMHLMSRIILEDLYQNEEVHEDFYPTSPGLDDTDGMNAVFTEFNLPGKFEGQEF